MIKVSVLYPHEAGAGFDMEYYLDKHIPMVRELLGDACKGIAFGQGLAGGTPDAPPAFTATCDLLFESADAFQWAFEPHAQTIMADIANYTSIKPLIQISEVKLS